MKTDEVGFGQAGFQEAAVGGIHLGSGIALAETDVVVRSHLSGLRDHIRRVPDVATADRRSWKQWNALAYDQTAGIELIDGPEGIDGQAPLARLAIHSAELVLERLGFADAAIGSFKTFSDLKDQGVFGERVRFMVCVPSPLGQLMTLVEPTSRAGVEPAYVRQVLAELDEIAGVIPHEELALQWNVSHEIGIWEGAEPAYFADARAGVADRLDRLIAAIPASIEVGVHLCYGDPAVDYIVTPPDLSVVVDIANGIARRADRPIQWIQIPVPAEHHDHQYFKPLERLNLQPVTEIYLGVVHHDGRGASLRRIAAASEVIDGFGIATECGSRERAAAQLEALFDLRGQLVDPVRPTGH